MPKLKFNRKLPAADCCLKAVLSFFHESGDATLNAAALLGGATAHRRCLRLMSDLAESKALSWTHKSELVRLHQLLMLENVGEPDTEESARFSEIDINDPRVAEMCLLADRLFDLLIAINEHVGDCEVLAAALPKRSAA